MRIEIEKQKEGELYRCIGTDLVEGAWVCLTNFKDNPHNGNRLNRGQFNKMVCSRVKIDRIVLKDILKIIVLKSGKILNTEEFDKLQKEFNKMLGRKIKIDKKDADSILKCLKEKGIVSVNRRKITILKDF